MEFPEVSELALKHGGEGMVEVARKAHAVEGVWITMDHHGYPVKDSSPKLLQRPRILLVQYSAVDVPQ